MEYSAKSSGNLPQEEVHPDFHRQSATGIYHSGDTSIFTDLKLFGELYPVEIAILCMDGIAGFPFEMSGDEAAMAARFLNAKVAIPMHYPAGSVEPLKFKKAAAGR